MFLKDLHMTILFTAHIGEINTKCKHKCTKNHLDASKFHVFRCFVFKEGSQSVM